MAPSTIFCVLGMASSATSLLEWDGVIPDQDACWLFDAFKASPIKRDIKISRGTHLMHLEAMRGALYNEANTFLLGEGPTLKSHPRVV
jgi:hypothetical protein